MPFRKLIRSGQELYDMEALMGHVKFLKTVCVSPN